jgi:bifunctional DNA-binding transcriptional regulator/antitoxin component of YhaV-PrlF toxin-antitoxin module
MAGKATSKCGLICSHGSDLDARIPRPKLPKTALPPELRKKMGLKPRTEDDSSEIYNAGSGVLKAAGSGQDGCFLKKGSGIPASVRTSGLNRSSDVGRAVISRATIGNSFVMAKPTGYTKSARRVPSRTAEIKNSISTRTHF